MAALFAQGDALTSDLLNGVQASYAVTWAASGTAPAIGNGTLTGRWSRLGDLMFVTISLALGSTTTTGTGTWTFSLPATAQNAGTAPAVPGHAVALQHGVQFYAGVVKFASTTTLLVNSTNTAAWGQLDPFTWANLDTLQLSAWFPLA